MKFPVLAVRILTAFFCVNSLEVAHAQRRGGSDGGGGGALVRYSSDAPDKQVLSAELLDLWEASNLRLRWDKPEAYRLNIPYSDEPVAIQLARALSKLEQAEPFLAERVKKDLAYVMSNDEDLPENIEIELPADAKNVYRQKGTKLVGMMYFDGETEKLSIKREIFDKLINNTHIAAAWMHEAVYKSLRDMDAIAQRDSRDSTVARKINACMFAVDDCFGIANGHLTVLSALEKSQESYQCESKDMSAKLFIVPSSAHTGGLTTVMYQTRIGGRELAFPIFSSGMQTDTPIAIYSKNLYYNQFGQRLNHMSISAFLEPQVQYDTNKYDPNRKIVGLQLTQTFQANHVKFAATLKCIPIAKPSK